MATLSRGIVVTVVLILGLLIAAACASAAPPTPAVAPTQPPRAAAATPVVSKPAPEPEWKVEWDKVLAAAKKEGKVVVAAPPGDLFRQAAMEFQKAYPEIKLEYTGSLGRDIIPKILAERQAGLHLWDVYIAGAGGMLSDLLPNKVFDPLRPVLILPDALDDGKWHGGFNAGYLDTERKYVYQFFGYLSFVVDVNRDIAPRSELSKIDQLVDPKWKGKIAWNDPRRAGSGRRNATTLLIVKGEDWYRKILAQDIVVYEDTRRMLENFVRGRYAAALGLMTAEMEQFREEGLLGSIESLEPHGPGGAHITGGSGHVSLMNKAPNPNAAKVFINWLLSQEGQKAYAQHTNTNSRRLDVEGPPETAPRPGVEYVNTSDEAQLPVFDRSGEIAKEMIK